jgi:AraC-like DNA-binding protein
MLYLEKIPSEPLVPWIRSLWYCHAPALTHRRERVLPNGCIEIILNLHRDSLVDCADDGTATVISPAAIVVGARARFEVIDTSDLAELMGIVIRPGGFAGFFRQRADLFFQQSIALENIWREPSLLDALRETKTPAEKLCMLERSLLRLLRAGASRSSLVDQAMYLFRRRHLSVAGAASSAGISERRLSQVFREEVGIAPKMWCRIHRFQAATRALYAGADVPWPELALRCGYYDQSHFANDFRAFSGIDPTTYSALRGRWRNHVRMQ